LITGGTIPATFMFVDNGGDPFVIIPIFGRIGTEIMASKDITPWMLIELGPAIAIGNGGTNTEFAFRAWLGVTFW